MEDCLFAAPSEGKASDLGRWAHRTVAGCLIVLSLAQVSGGAEVVFSMMPTDVGMDSELPPAETTQLFSWDDWQRKIHAELPGPGNAQLAQHTDAMDDIRLAANLQPSPPSPIEGEGQRQSIQEAETLGEEPDEQPLQFLRQVTPLLAPGKWQLDYGVQYLFAETLFPSVVGDPAILTETRVRQRLVTIPLEFRYGLCQGAQVFIHAPFGWSNTELAYVGQDESTSTGGIGDVTAGLTYLLRQGDNCRPDIIGTVALTARTGNAGSLIANSLFNPQSQLGQGFWAVSGNVLVVHSCDPLVIFYGVGARFRFSRDFTDVFDVFPEDDYNVDPGEEYSYQLGVGFAVTPRITLSTSLFGGYVVEDRINGDRLELGNLEPIRMRLAVTIARPSNIVEPYANIGMTNDAPDAVIGITWTY